MNGRMTVVALADDPAAVALELRHRGMQIEQTWQDFGKVHRSQNTVIDLSVTGLGAIKGWYYKDLDPRIIRERLSSDQVSDVFVFGAGRPAAVALLESKYVFDNDPSSATVSNVRSRLVEIHKSRTLALDQAVPFLEFADISYLRLSPNGSQILIWANEEQQRFLSSLSDAGAIQMSPVRAQKSQDMALV